MNRPAVNVEGLTFTFAGRDAPSLRELSFELPKGSWTLLLGRTGSGKSTLLRALAGLIPHHTSGTLTGHVLLFDRDTRDCTPAELAATAGLVQQAPDDQICATRVSAEVAFGLENLAIKPDAIATRIGQALAEVGLERFADQPTANLSGGQKQRLVLASIVAMQPRLLLLDEPLSQLDPAGCDELLSRLVALRAAGMTIVMVEHRLDDVMHRADRVLLLDEGSLVADQSPHDDRLPALFERLGLELPELAGLATVLGRPPAFTADEFIANLPAIATRSSVKLSQGRSVSHDKLPNCVNDEIVLRVRDLSFAHRRGDAPIWQGVNFEITRAERVALLGPNGAGKSTLLAVLAGLMKPAAGQVTVEPRVAQNGAQPRAERGLLLQNCDLMLFCPTVRDELAFGPRQLDRHDGDTVAMLAARELDLEMLLDEPPLALSQGQRLRTALAATLAMAPRVLFLDEPTTGQDFRQIERLLAAVSPCKKSPLSPECVLFATHDLRAAARHADRVLVLAEGKLLADCRPDELLADDALLTAARLRRPPLFELRARLGLAGTTVGELARELAP